MGRSGLAIIIPALNEARTISDVVTRVLVYGLPIVVDDGSSDQTTAVAEAAGATVVSHPTNLGYDQALNSGFKLALSRGCRILLTLDADGQHDPTLINSFLEKIRAGADVVVGVRGKHQRMAESLFAAYTSHKYGISDPLCGMKAYRSELYAALGHFDSYGSIGTELMLFAARSGHKIDQVACPVRSRPGASRFGSKFSGNCRILRSLVYAASPFGKAPSHG